jgi:ParB/RepB/Spo0J family partition protein
MPERKDVSTGKGTSMLKKMLGIPEGQKGRPPQDEPARPGQVIDLEIERIGESPHQVRRLFDKKSLKFLSRSLQDNGLLQPILVRRVSGSETYDYEVIAGERRLRAAKQANWTRIPAIVKEGADRANVKVLAAVENIQREDLCIVEKTIAIGKLMEEFNNTFKVAAAVGFTRRSVERYVRIFNAVYRIERLAEFFEERAAEIDLQTAEALAGIAEKLESPIDAGAPPFQRFLDDIGEHGFKVAIRKYRERETGPRESVSCSLKETETQYILTIKCPRDSAVSPEDRRAIQKKYRLFLEKVSEKEDGEEGKPPKGHHVHEDAAPGGLFQETFIDTEKDEAESNMSMRDEREPESKEAV